MGRFGQVSDTKDRSQTEFAVNHSIVEMAQATLAELQQEHANGATYEECEDLYNKIVSQLIAARHVAIPTEMNQWRTKSRSTK